MTATDDYSPTPIGWVRDQVETIEHTGDTRSVHIRNRPVVMLTMRGAKTGKVRKVPLMRVEHDGAYLAVGSDGGDPRNPAWTYNLRANPDIVLQDGTESWSARARRLEGEERAEWWERAVATFPWYAEYQRNTDRVIPIFLLERTADAPQE